LFLSFWLKSGIVWILCSTVAGAAAEFKVPALTGPVVDEADVLNQRTELALTQALRALHDKGGSQINVLTVSSLDDTPIEQASIRIVEQWKLGGRKNDNGVLLLFAVKDRKLRIEVGQGLEGQLTDADSKRIIDQGIVPLLKSGDYDSAAVVGTFQIAQKTDPDFDLTPYLEGKARVGSRTQRHSPNGIPLRGGVIMVILLLFFILGGGSRGRRGLYGGGGWGGRGFGGGGGSWGGGGGGFSGGGASGDW
jgi:uncharacterized protein